MGIRFSCPNGHKLHVKSFLAGRRGICPHCGVKVQIPTTSQLGDAALTAQIPHLAAPPHRRDSHVTKAAASASPEAASISAPEPPPTIGPPSTPQVPSPLGPPHDRVSLGEEFSEDAGAPSASASVSKPSAQPWASGPVPLDDDPAASWYVRNADGQQFGPATSVMLNEWIAEGRINADAFLWRDGWSDWQSAATILTTGQLELGPVSGPSVRPMVAIEPSGTTHLHRTTPRAKRQTTLAAIAILSLASVVLFAILVVVLRMNGG